MYIANYLAERKEQVVRFHTHAYIVHSSHYFHCIHIGDRPIEECGVYICANREPGWICGTRSSIA